MDPYCGLDCCFVWASGGSRRGTDFLGLVEWGSEMLSLGGLLLLGGRNHTPDHCAVLPVLES